MKTNYLFKKTYTSSISILVFLFLFQVPYRVQAHSTNNTNQTKGTLEYNNALKIPKLDIGKPTRKSPEIVRIKSQKYTYSQMIKDINNINKQYPNIVKVKSIGKSVLGRDLECIIIGSESSPNKILITGSIHGREYMTTQLIMKQIDYLLQNYENGTYKAFKIKNIFNDTSIYYVPMMNPDGASLSQSGLSSVNDAVVKKKLLSYNHGSSNFTKWKANAHGVDLNRNFSLGWNLLKNLKPSLAEYKGPKPESEPESKAIANLIRADNFKTLVCYHVTGSIIYWYNGQKGNILSRDYSIAKNLSSMTGYKLVPISQSTTSGGLKDWYIPTFKNPGFTIEVGKPNSTAPLSISEFSDIWKRNKDIPLYLATLYSKNIPSKDTTYYNLVKSGNDLMAKGKYNEAIDLYDKAIKLDSNSIEAYYNKSIALYKLERLDEALNILDNIIKIQPKEAEAYYNMACIYSIQEKPDECLINLRKAVEINPNLKKEAMVDKNFDNIRELPEFISIINN